MTFGQLERIAGYFGIIVYTYSDIYRFNNKCWYAHGPHELRSVPHLENNLIAKNTSLAEVLEVGF